MAIGDIAGDIQNTYGQGLTPEQRAARQAALAQGSAPSSLATSPISAPPAGPIGRAQQQLAPSSSLNDPSFGLSSQGDARQTSFDVTNTPSKYLPPVSQPAPVVQPVASPAASPPPTQVASPAQQAPAPLSSLDQANLVTPIPQGPQVPPLTNLSQIGTTVGTSLLGGGAKNQSPDQTLGGVIPTATSPTVDPYSIKSVNDQNSLKSANLLANSMPADPLSALGSLLQNQYRPTGIGTDAKGGQIVAQVGPNGEPQFSNIQADQQSAKGLGQISVSPNPQPVSTQPSTLATAGGIPASTPAPPPDFASLGSAGNLGDGIGTFSQAQPGDAALSMDRFQKAHDLRESYKNQDRLDQALGAKWSADHTNIVHDGSKPLSLADVRFDQGQQQTQAKADGNVNGAQGLVDASIKDRASEQQLRQSTRLEDALTAATAPNATPEQKQRYQSLVDPTGAAGLDRQLKVATLDKTQAETNQTRQNTSTGATTQQQAQQDRQRSIDGQVSSVDQALSSVNKLLGTDIDPKNPDGPRLNEDKGLKAAVGLGSLLPTRPGSAAADFEARNETLKAQTFLPQVSLLKGMGALSNTEGERLSDSIASLSTKQSASAYRANLKVISDVFAKTKGRLQSGTLITPGSSQEFAQPITFGSQPAQGGKLQAQPQQVVAAASPVQISTEAAYKALPSGAQYIDPQGNHRSKP